MYKKVSVVILLLLFLVTAVSAQPNVERSAPMTAVLNDTITVTLKVEAKDPQTALDVIEFLPQGWEVVSWDVSNYNKSLVTYEYASQRTFAGKDRSAAHWGLTNVFGDVTITYQTKAVTGVYAEFITVWTYPEGFSSKTSLATVLPKAGVPYCGNGMCDTGENIFNCPQDCPVATQIRVFPIDLTLLAVFSIIGLVIVIVTYRYKVQKAKAVEAEKERISLEDLRAYLKLGLKRGYQIREMIDALRGANVDVSLLEEMERSERMTKAEDEIKKLLKKTPGAKERQTDEVIDKLKGVISNLRSDHEVKKVVDSLDGKGIDTKPVRVAAKKLKPKKEKPARKIPEDDKVITRLKELIDNMSKHDKNNIYKELKYSK